METKKFFVYLGSSGFPYGLAEIQKIILISKCLVLTGNDVTIICNKGVHHKIDHPEMRARGCFQNIEYEYTSGTPFYNNNFFKRNLLKIKGIINEFSSLRKRKKYNKLDFAILSTHDFNSVVYYFFLAKLFGFKIILNYVEFYSGVKKKRFQIKKWLNDKLFDRYAPVLSDGILPISEFLINHLDKISPGKKYLKIPGLTDYSRYNDIETSKEEKYFLFCGAAAYKETILFTIDAFNLLDKTDFYLYLVINGQANDINEIKDYSNSTRKKDFIKFYSKLSEKQLFTFYKNAKALLIPLRPTFQDIARFPHKIGEYLASGNPVISTNYGEVKYYFHDMVDMLLAETYQVDQFAAKMKIAVDDAEAAEQIGIRGKTLGLSLFDYQTRASFVNEFFNNLYSKQ